MNNDAIELADKMADVFRAEDCNDHTVLLATTMLLASMIRLSVSNQADRSLTSDEIKLCMSGWEISTRIANNVFAK